MRGDFSRLTFDPAKHFSRVLMQQGRVQLDADWNEQSSLLLYQLRTLARAVIGPYGGIEDDAFRVTADNDGNLHISKGGYFVNGILCVNEEELTFTSPDLLKARQGSTPVAGDYLVYLSVTERHITFVNDDDIREKALGDGVDTTSRTKVVALLSAVAVDNLSKLTGKDLDDAIKAALGKLRPGNDSPKMRASVKESEANPHDVCSVPPFAQFRGDGNQLYRVEIHAPSKGGKGATFKWSRENGSVVFPVTKAAVGNKVSINRFGRDGRFTLRKGDWVEFEDDELIASDESLELARVESVDADSVTLDTAPPVKAAKKNESFGTDQSLHPLLRRWDHATGSTYSKGAIAIQDEKQVYPLEQGIQVEFHAEGQEYVRGDYWVIPARTLLGDIEWPKEAPKPGDTDKPKGKYLPARRAEGGLAPLASMTIGGDGKPTGAPKDLRSLIQPIVKRVT
jgi:hypothetical protein